MFRVLKLVILKAGEEPGLPRSQPVSRPHGTKNPTLETPLGLGRLLWASRDKQLILSIHIELAGAGSKLPTQPGLGERHHP